MRKPFFKANVVYRALRPNEIKSLFFKGQVIHGTDNALYLILNILLLRVLIQYMDKVGNRSKPMMAPVRCCASTMVCPPLPQPKSAACEI